MLEVEIWLVHPDEEACAAFAERFTALPDHVVQRCRFEELPPHDCFVTAGNSYGIMTAGIDAAVVNFFGPQLMDKVQLKIMDEYLGEQPIGTAFVVPTGNDQRPFVCHAPTMRTPGSIEGTDKIYCATWAALLAVYRHNCTSSSPIRTVAVPAMGAGFGGVRYSEVARQMSVAWRHFRNLPHRTLDWDWVIARQKLICYDGSRKVCQ